MYKPWAEYMMSGQCPIPFSLPVVTSDDYSGICLLHETSLFESNRADSSLYHHSACGSNSHHVFDWLICLLPGNLVERKFKITR